MKLLRITYRYPILKEIDTRALSKIEHHNGMNAFKQNVLLEKEEELVSIPVVAMRGLVAPSNDFKVGGGVLMLSKMQKDDGSSVHRIHFYLEDKTSDFYAKQTYMTSNVGTQMFLNLLSSSPLVADKLYSSDTVHA